MSIARRVQEELSEQGLDYEVITHEPTVHSQQTAEAARIPGDRLAKGVVMKDDQGPMLAVIPASHSVDVDRLNDLTGRHLALMPEAELARLFTDCEIGAVPAAGSAYGLPTVTDSKLLTQPEVWFEGGDHESLLRVTGSTFRRMMRKGGVGPISRHS